MSKCFGGPSNLAQMTCSRPNTALLARRCDPFLSKAEAGKFYAGRGARCVSGDGLSGPSLGLEVRFGSPEQANLFEREFGPKVQSATVVALIFADRSTS